LNASNEEKTTQPYFPDHRGVGPRHVLDGDAAIRGNTHKGDTGALWQVLPPRIA